jgi:hypothetical protein
MTGSAKYKWLKQDNCSFVSHLRSSLQSRTGVQPHAEILALFSGSFIMGAVSFIVQDDSICAMGRKMAECQGRGTRDMC